MEGVLRIVPWIEEATSHQTVALHPVAAQLHSVANEAIRCPSKSISPLPSIIESSFDQRSFPTQKQAIDFIEYYRTYDRDIKVDINLPFHSALFLRTTGRQATALSLPFGGGVPR